MLTFTNSIINLNRNTSISGTLTVSGATTLNTLTTSGNVNINGTTVHNNNIFVTNGSSETVSRGIYLRNNNDGGCIRMCATSSNNSYLEIATGDDAAEPIYVRQYTGGNIINNADNMISGTLTRSLTLLDVSGNTNIPGNTYINGALTVNGATTLNTLTTNSSLTVNGTTTLNDNAVIGTTSANKTLSIYGNEYITNTLTVGGITNLKNSTISGTLAVTSNETIAGSLTVSGATSLNTLTTSSNASINGDLTITTNSYPTNTGIINVTTNGNADWMRGLNIMAPNLASNYHFTFVVGKANSAYNCAYFGYKHQGIGIIGIHSADELITFSSSNVNLNRNTSITGTLNVSGNSSLYSLTTSNNATINGALTVIGNSSLSTLTTSSNTIVNGALTVSGATALNTLTTSSNATVNGDLNVPNRLTTTSTTVTVYKPTTIDNNTTINGVVTVNVNNGSPLCIWNSSLAANNYILMLIGHSNVANRLAHFGFKYNSSGVGIGCLGVYGTAEVIAWNSNEVYLNKPVFMYGVVKVTDPSPVAWTWSHNIRCNVTGSQVSAYTVGNGEGNDQFAYYGFRNGGIGTIGLQGTGDIVTYTKAAINLNKNTYINGGTTFNAGANKVFVATTSLSDSAADIFNPSLAANAHFYMNVGKSFTLNNCAHFGFRNINGGTAFMGLHSNWDLVYATSTSVTLGRNTSIGGTLNVTGNSTLTTLSTSSNTSIGGTLNVTGNSTLQNARFAAIGIGADANSSDYDLLRLIVPMANNRKCGIQIGQSWARYNCAYIHFYYISANNVNNYLSFSMHDNDHIFRMVATGECIVKNKLTTPNLYVSGDSTLNTLTTNGSINSSGVLTVANNIIINNSTNDTVERGIYIRNNNDSGSIRMRASAVDSGYLEIATSDNGTEPIYVRQYTGGAGTNDISTWHTTLVRSLTLLDASGNTTIPGTLNGINLSTLNSNVNTLLTHNHDTIYSKLDHNHDTVYSPSTHNHDSEYFKINQDIISTGHILLYDGSATGWKGVMMRMNDDAGGIRFGATAYNNGYLELCVADDGTEPIYVTQYTGGWAANNNYGNYFKNIKRRLTLLDGNGNTSVPGSISISGGATIASNTTINGTTTLRNTNIDNTLNVTGEIVSPKIYASKTPTTTTLSMNVYYSTSNGYYYIIGSLDNTMTIYCNLAGESQTISVTEMTYGPLPFGSGSGNDVWYKRIGDDYFNAPYDSVNNITMFSCLINTHDNVVDVIDCIINKVTKNITEEDCYISTGYLSNNTLNKMNINEINITNKITAQVGGTTTDVCELLNNLKALL